MLLEFKRKSDAENLKNILTNITGDMNDRSGPTNLNNPTAKLSDGTAIGYAASAILGRVS